MTPHSFSSQAQVRGQRIMASHIDLFAFLSGNALASTKRLPAISFSAKLSYNRELKPLDTVVFDTVITNNGEAYNAETGECEVSQR